MNATSPEQMKRARNKAITLQAAYDKTFALYWAGSRSEEQLVSTMRSVIQTLGPDTPVAAIDAAAIASLKTRLKRQGRSPGTINRKLSALSKILHTAEDLGWIERVPKIPREVEAHARVKVLDEAQVFAIVSTMRHLDYTDAADLCDFLLETGLRVGEAVLIRWSDWRGGLLHVPNTKGGKSREIPLSGRCEKLLNARKSYPGSGPYQGITQSRLTYTWNRAKEHLSIRDAEVVPNALRDTFAVRMLKRGVPIQAVQRWLGHKNIQDTMTRYAQFVPMDLDVVRDALEDREP